jgi:hypothetical protein
VRNRHSYAPPKHLGQKATDAGGQVDDDEATRETESIEPRYQSLYRLDAAGGSADHQ